MPNRDILIVGATRGLGKALKEQYVKLNKMVHCTALHKAPEKFHHTVHWVEHVDMTKETAGSHITAQWEERSGERPAGQVKIDVLIIAASGSRSRIHSETLDNLNWDKEMAMYKLCAVGLLFLVRHLVNEGFLAKGSKVILVAGDAGGVGDYGARGSKAAQSIIAEQLSADLKDKGIAVAMVEQGLLRKDPTIANDEDFQNDPHAIKPADAACHLIDFIDSFSIEQAGARVAAKPDGTFGTAGMLHAIENLERP